jgi:beta-mannosidase
MLAAVLAAGSLAVAQQGAANAVLPLDQGWQFREMKLKQEPETGWLAAKVPGDVHLDLLENKIISDPFFRDNEAKLQWIEKTSWEYRLAFDVPAATLDRANVEMVFEGLDGPAAVWLNGSEVLYATNSFRQWRVPVKQFLRPGKNSVTIIFESPLVVAERLGKQDPWIAKAKTEPKTLLRKPAYEYGWDWGPRFVTSGIWKPIRIEAWDRARLADFFVRQRDISKDVAHLDAEVEIEASKAGTAQVTVSYAGHGRVPASQQATVSVIANLHPGRNIIDLPIEILHPKLWYPAGYGEQPRYNFNARVSVGQGSIGSRAVVTGLRSVVLDRHPDKWGKSFQFLVNGTPVFAKGADVIPFDSFPNRVTTADYRKVLEGARDANMNMIRHWGGGYYETDEFYTLCDELGLMIWQDFMFGNDWQPGNASFKQNIEQEAEDQVRRLRNHPSIVLWSGNNETELAFGWAPRPALPADVRQQLWQDYLTEFSGILPRVVARLNPETPYWPSSPSSDYEPQSATYHSGDDHIWDVWHGRVPFSTYEKHHARFVTEYGFQSFPEMRSIETFTVPADRANIYTPVMLAHQKNKEGNDIIHNYLLKDYAEPKDFASFLYVSQVLQAEGIKIGAEHFRRSRPETMGSIYWQLNDCWPVASWASLDYYGRWKALQFYARRFYAPVLVSPHVEQGAVKVYIVSDRTESKPATLRVRLMDFDGKVLLEESKPVRVEALTSKVYLDWPLKKLAEAGATDTSRVFVVADIQEGQTELSRNLIYLGPTKEIRLKPAALKVETVTVAGKIKIRVSSPVLARSVYLSFGNLDGKLSDNYFDVLPGETQEIVFTTKATLDAVKSQLRAVSLVDSFVSGSGGIAIKARP